LVAFSTLIDQYLEACLLAISIHSIHVFSICFQELKHLFEEKMDVSNTISRPKFPTAKAAKLGQLLFNLEYASLPETVRLHRANAILAVVKSGWQHITEADIDAIEREIEEEPSSAVKEKLRLALGGGG
jgi:hypothetical protein